MSRSIFRPRPFLFVSAASLVIGTLAACAATGDAPTAPLAPGAVRRTVGSTQPAVGATMRFGNPDMSGFSHMAPTAWQHTQGGHAVDKVFPGTVVIERGQTVAFESFPIHQIAVYAPGTQPTDIRVDADHLDDVETPFGTFPDVLINDPADRLALSPISFERITWTPDAATFGQPGRYLVICTLVFHFVPTKMYGWVEVR
jgi:hypothetical protein